MRDWMDFNRDGEVDSTERFFADEMLCGSREEHEALFGDAVFCDSIVIRLFGKSENTADCPSRRQRRGLHGGYSRERNWGLLHRKKITS